MSESSPSHSLHVSDLSIKGFRAIKDLSIEGLGRVTLITGKNNTGKSSILEALRLFAWNGSPRTLQSILSSREEYVRKRESDGGQPEAKSLDFIMSLFHGFPPLASEVDPIEISASGRDQDAKLTMRITWFAGRTLEGGGRELTELRNEPSQEPDFIPGITLGTEESTRTHTLDRYFERASNTWLEQFRFSCVAVSPFSGQRTSVLGSLWDKIALTDDEEVVVAALKSMDHRISDLSMVGGEGFPGIRRAMVRAKGIPTPVPLRSFGDGINHLFAIILSLINARGGILLIDEFENGLHYTVHLDVWKMIFRLAQQLDVQVFATSHSWDAVESFQQAGAEVPEQAALVRLVQRKGNIVPTVFTEDELAIVTRDGIEVR